MSQFTILIVDDDPIMLSLISEILSPSYKVRIANSGQRAIEIASSEPRPNLILLDVLMAGISGHTVLAKLQQDKATSGIPVIFVTSKEAMADEEKGLALGAVDYITKPIRPAILLARVKTHILLQQAYTFLQDKNVYLEQEISRRMAENQNIQDISIRALAHLAEVRDPETGAHILRTQSYVNRLAKELKNHPRFSNTITDNYIDSVTKSAPLHDIGKVGIPDNVLLKPGKLDADEWIIMKTHAAIGALAIERAEADVELTVKFLTLAKEIAHWHHERWDGGGYPDSLAGDDIPISARLMAIADVFDALISKRVYKDAFSFEQAKNIIVEGKGNHFDPDILEAFINCFDDFVKIALKYQSSATPN